MREQENEEPLRVHRTGKREEKPIHRPPMGNTLVKSLRFKV